MTTSGQTVPARSRRPRGKPAAIPEDRALRILDRAAELVGRWGYDKTSIDDIARAAAVAKGTIYLHFESREALFVALLRRERLLALEAIRGALVDAARPVGLTDLARATVAATGARPLLKALLIKDAEVLGRLRRVRGPAERQGAGRRGFFTYLERLREIGAIRSDKTIIEQSQMLATVFIGALVAPALLPKEMIEAAGPAEEVVADIVARTFDPGRRVSKATAEQAGKLTVRYIDAELEEARQKLLASLEPPHQRSSA